MWVMKFHSVILAFLMVLETAHSYGTITIGGFFLTEGLGASVREVAFRQAVNKVNAETALGSGSRRYGSGSNFAQQVERLSTADTLPAAQRVCSVLGKIGMAAIFGPDVEPVSGHIQSICDAKAIPHVLTHMQVSDELEHFTIDMYPDPRVLSRAYAEVLERNGWETLAVLYEDEASLVRLQEILKLPHFRKTHRLTLLQLPADAHYRHVLRGIMESHVRHVVVDCATRHVFDVLKQAQQVGMITDQYSFFITSLDLHTVSLEDFKYSNCNITGLRMVDPSDPHVILTVGEWREAERQQGSRLDISAHSLRTEDALLYDAVHLLADAIGSLEISTDVDVAPLDCDNDREMWQHGESLINFMKLVKLDGLTGHIEFDAAGRRTDFQLDLVELREAGLVKIGEWSPRGLNISSRRAPSLAVQNQTVIVTTLLKDPYTMLRESSKQRVGNDRYEGICMDIIDELSQALGFNYSFHTNPDDSPGSPDSNGKWNGMIGELLDGRAHLAISDLTITRSRQEVVDFSLQWLSLGIGLLYVKPKPSPPSLFSFLEPLSLEVWMYIALAYLGVSVFMFVLARFSPYEWDHPHPCHLNQELLENQFNFLNALWLSVGSLVQQGCDIMPKFTPYEWVNPHPCVDDPDEVENDINMRNGFWFTIGSLMQQGSDIAPKAVSTRMVAGTWWFFTLIMVSSYTANLAAFLTVETLNSPISSAEDLARQTKIKYGLYDKGSTGSFFRNSAVFPFDTMWEFMNKQTPSVFERSRRGPDRVSESDGMYAYFMESSTIEYVTQRRCDLRQVGGLLDNKGYGIAVGKNSPVSAQQLSEVILKMQENGKIQQLKTLWWKQKKDGGKCLESAAKPGVSPLSLENVGGVFVCLMCGVTMAVIQAGLEFFWSVREQSAEENVPFMSVVMKELRFVFRFRGNSKPVRRPITADMEDDVADIQPSSRPLSSSSSVQYVATEGYGYSSGVRV